MKLQDLIETQFFYKNLSKSLSEEIPWGTFSFNFKDTIKDKNKKLNEILTFSNKELFRKFDYTIFSTDAVVELTLEPKKIVSIDNKNELYLDFIKLNVEDGKNSNKYDLNINSIAFLRKFEDYTIKYNVSSQGNIFMIIDSNDDTFNLYEDHKRKLRTYVKSNNIEDSNTLAERGFMFLVPVFDSLGLISLKQGNHDLIFDIIHGGKKLSKEEEESMFLIYDVALDMKNDYSFFTDVSKVDLNKLFFHKDKKIKNHIGH